MSTPLRVAEGMVVGVHWKLSIAGGGPTIEQSGHNPFFGEQPLRFVVGRRQTGWNLDQELLGRQVGDVVRVQRSIPPPDPDLVFQVPLSRLPKEPKKSVVVPNQIAAGEPVQPGMNVYVPAQGEATLPMVFRVVDSTKETVTLDGNNLLSGAPLELELEIKEIRPADPDEIAHASYSGPFLASRAMLKKVDLANLDFTEAWIAKFY